MIESMSELTTLQRSALEEVGNIGAGHAVYSLSQLIEKKITINVTNVGLLGVGDFIKVIGGQERWIVGVHLKVVGGAQGGIVLAFIKESALSLVDILMNQAPGTTRKIGEIEESALKEAGSILSAAYLMAISEFMKLSLIPSVPGILYDTAGVVVGSAFQQLSRSTNIMLGVENQFSDTAHNIKGHFLFLPDDKGIYALFKALGVTGQAGLERTARYDVQ